MLQLMSYRPFCKYLKKTVSTFTDHRWGVHAVCNDCWDETELGPRSVQERAAQFYK